MSLELRCERGDRIPQLLCEAPFGTDEENDDPTGIAWSFLIAYGCAGERVGSEFGDVGDSNDKMLSGCP
jgi:hypothetical protein